MLALLFDTQNAPWLWCVGLVLGVIDHQLFEGPHGFIWFSEAGRRLGVTGVCAAYQAVRMVELVLLCIA